MKKLLFIIVLFYSSITYSWYEPYGIPYGIMPMGGYPYGAMGAMGYGWGIQAPSFNYNTVIQQSPPIVINNNDQYQRQYQPNNYQPNNCRK